MDANVLLAYDYPVLGVFLTVLFLAVGAMWLILLFRVVADIFRDHSMGGLGKTAWLVCVMFLPFLGVFMYLIARGDKMSEREARREAVQSVSSRSADHPSAQDLDELARLADLKAHGDLSDAEYERAKTRILH
ncbi:SHOCT domain-containing protein [Streptomyces sp. NPDC004647]|uniref:SHOCT domain-containing protein n=1 Tax=Streptomyces sp. NPDC004647 TaxID=3154671 RepID=UPI0033A48A10